MILCIILTLSIGIKAFAQTSILDQAKQAIEDMEYSEALNYSIPPWPCIPRGRNTTFIVV